MRDESALRSALASLDDPSSSLHWWLGFWTFLVAVGVALEVVFVVWEYWDELRDFKRGIIHPPERPHTILFVLGLLGAGLVAAGVSGELWEESQIAKLETCIRKGDDALFLLLSKEAGDAAKSAQIAHDEVDAVKKEAAALKIQLGAGAKRAEEIDSDLARTQYLMSGRSINDFDSLVRQLKQYEHQTVHIGSPSEAEQDMFCDALYKAAHAAEVNALDECGRTEQVGMMPTGVVISGPSQQETMDIAQILLHTTNLGPGGTQSGLKAPELRIFVGARPPFMATQARGVKSPAKKVKNRAKPNQ
jgi:hypothetical protein